MVLSRQQLTAWTSVYITSDAEQVFVVGRGEVWRRFSRWPHVRCDSNAKFQNNWTLIFGNIVEFRIANQGLQRLYMRYVCLKLLWRHLIVYPLTVRSSRSLGRDVSLSCHTYVCMRIHACSCKQHINVLSTASTKQRSNSARHEESRHC